MIFGFLPIFVLDNQRTVVGWTIGLLRIGYCQIIGLNYYDSLPPLPCNWIGKGREGVGARWLWQIIVRETKYTNTPVQYTNTSMQNTKRQTQIFKNTTKNNWQYFWWNLKYVEHHKVQSNTMHLQYSATLDKHLPRMSTLTVHIWTFCLSLAIAHLSLTSSTFINIMY